ncbi:uncharacterized protein LOC116291020, partial [Actinia tenebrosa]|uniref:Uncharacterized protein LOC116291020 n=1 Tax=Actinia tenebrosa TaxID=6105 RepID=A0A6P8HGB4_ACTTE
CYSQALCPFFLQESNSRNAHIDGRTNESCEQNIDIHGGERPNQPTEHDEEPIANDNAPANSSTSSVNANSLNGDFNAIQRQVSTNMLYQSNILSFLSYICYYI